MVKIKDVAKQAGVSTATVSRYLNSPGMLKAETAQRIKEAIEVLNYRPSPLAVSMRTRKTNTIALVIPTLKNLYYVDLHSAIHKACRDNGYTLNLYTTEQNPLILEQYLQEIPSHQCDGAIICFLDEDRVTEDLEAMQKSFPLVLITSDPQKTQFHNVFVDALDGVFKATSHLTELGRKRIAFAVGGKDSLIIVREKYKGYKLALERADLPVNPKYLFQGHINHYYTGFMAARYFLTLPEVPDGIVCSTDDVAIGVVKYLLQGGYKIPDDVAVMGFNGISIIDTVEPTITTVAQPIQEIADSAVRMLTETINYPHGRKKRQVYTTQIRVGNSTVKNAPTTYYFDD